MKPLPKLLEQRAQKIVEVWRNPQSGVLWTKLLEGLTKHQQSLVVLRAEYLQDWNEGGKVQWSGKVQTLASLLGENKTKQS